MTNEPNLTLVGNLATDPELRHTGDGSAVLNFRIGCTPTRYNGKTNQHEDGETYWQDCTIWRGKAVAVAALFRKGDKVIVTGHLRTSKWTNSAGREQSKPDLTVLECGLCVIPEHKAPPVAPTAAPEPAPEPWGVTADQSPAPDFSGSSRR